MEILFNRKHSLIDAFFLFFLHLLGSIVFQNDFFDIEAGSDHIFV